MIDLKTIDFVKPMPENMNIMSMTVEDFKAVHFRTATDGLSCVYSIVLLPAEEMHEYGFRYMNYVAIDKDHKPICRLPGGSDVLHLDGIGGYGLDFDNALKTQSIRPKNCSIDCLPCGLFRVFSNHRLLVDNIAVSTYCINSVDEKRMKEYLYKCYKSKTPKTNRCYLQSDDDELLFEFRQTEEQARMYVGLFNKCSEYYIYVVRQSEEAD